MLCRKITAESASNFEKGWNNCYVSLKTTNMESFCMENHARLLLSIPLYTVVFYSGLTSTTAPSKFERKTFLLITCLCSEASFQNVLMGGVVWVIGLETLPASWSPPYFLYHKRQCVCLCIRFGWEVGKCVRSVECVGCGMCVCVVCVWNVRGTWGGICRVCGIFACSLMWC